MAKYTCNKGIFTFRDEHAYYNAVLLNIGNKAGHERMAIFTTEDIDPGEEIIVTAPDAKNWKKIRRRWRWRGVADAASAFVPAPARMPPPSAPQPPGVPGLCRTDAGDDAETTPRPSRTPQPPTAPEAPDSAHAVDKEIQQANEEARARKQLLRRTTPQPTLKTRAPAEPRDGLKCCEMVTTQMHERAPRTAQGRHASKVARARRRGALQKQVQQQVEEESRQILQQMEPLRRESGTVVTETIESLESVQTLGAALRKQSQRAKAKPGRQLLGKMRWEIAFFRQVRGHRAQ